MRSGLGRTIVLLAGGALATAGWGAVFPFLYADISSARGLGGGVATGTFTAFALGSVIAAPMAGRLADRANPTVVAVTARIALAFSVLWLATATQPLTIWLAAAVFGASVAMAQPAIQIILLSRTPADRRRDIFAWQFIAINLGAALGAALGGSLVNLSSQSAMLPVYLVAVVSSLVSAVVVAIAGRGAHACMRADATVSEPVSYAVLLRSRQIRWLLAIALLITLACYAQFDAGLPAFVLDSTNTSPATLGSAVALNAILVAVLVGPVVAFTRRRQGTSLLALCAVLWVGCWLIFALPLITSGSDSLYVFLGFAGISLGETMMAPILSALAVSLAPAGASGATLSAVTGAGTIATAIGPILSGALLGLGLPSLFIAMQVLFCLGAAAAALRLRAITTARPRPASVLELLAGPEDVELAA